MFGKVNLRPESERANLRLERPERAEFSAVLRSGRANLRPERVDLGMGGLFLGLKELISGLEGLF